MVRAVLIVVVLLWAWAGWKVVAEKRKRAPGVDDMDGYPFRDQPLGRKVRAIVRFMTGL